MRPLYPSCTQFQQWDGDYPQLSKIVAVIQNECCEGVLNTAEDKPSTFGVLSSSTDKLFTPDLLHVLLDLMVEFDNAVEPAQKLMA